ncbi:transposase [Lignipirellula cremea]|uniref:transposase n=1 Tax=Lignipirellula cremea TaxID=2528010 RepID=UPI0011A78E4C|nr:transposase [Lignipirellula cremea]
MTTIVTPDAFLRWHRELVAQKWDQNENRKSVGRPRSNLNAFIEPFMRSLKSEPLSRMIFFGENLLRRAVSSFLEHYHGERNRQGLENKRIQPADEVGQLAGKIECQERLGGLLQ